MAKVPPCVSLILKPTPFHKLERMSKVLGIDLWIKRDDLTGFAMGGNKGRKLEFLLADILEKGADTVVTCGALQSNFVRQLGTACSVFGLQCHAVVMDLPYEVRPDVTIPHLDHHNGNVMMDKLVGVVLHQLENGTWDHLFEQMESVSRNLESAGRKVYRISVGGNSPQGAYGFVKAGEELDAQLGEDVPFDWIVTASSSGSTQTGLSWHYRNTSTKVLGISSDPEPELVDEFAELSSQLAELIGQGEGMKSEDFLLNVDYVDGGYGIPSDEGQKALAQLARVEGIFLDPVYSAKAFAGLIDLAEKNQISGKVLFWHTGGTPSFFALPH